MAHTSAFKVPDIEDPVTVVHNSGWDGTATVVWKDRDGRKHRVQIPAGLLVQVGKQAAFDKVRGEVVSFLESLDPGPL
jgi:hypothetical protein